MRSISAFHRIHKLRIKANLLHDALYYSERMGVDHHSPCIFYDFILFLHRIGLYFGVVDEPLFIKTVNKKLGGTEIGFPAEKDRKPYPVALFLGGTVSCAVGPYPLFPRKIRVNTVVSSIKMIGYHYSGISAGFISPRHLRTGVDGTGTGLICVTVSLINIHDYPSKKVLNSSI